ncbi:uncharacterized protein DUF4203 [Mumia flava]|uniref:Uncharacterized protein DUF4203 n=1 Tax=Mumia flava TaxID=1348852 RepID=A0A0B2BPN1_9ACTN|nr:DUF4203 domain-containing protein [Mumia flava]PJJ57080.1 uncharacterized protein DUF4203 [Mumia flava]
MNDVLLGVILLVIGLVLVFWGRPALQALIGVFGALIGFVIGAQVGQEIAGGAVLDSAWSWVAAIVGAIVLGLLAYVWYWLGVVLWVAAAGYWLGVVIAGAFGADEDWVLTTTGLAVAAALVVLAVVAKFPALLLVLVSAWAGANLTITAVMLFVGEVGSARVGEAYRIAEPAWGWFLAVLVVFVIGVVVQLRSGAGRTSTGSSAPAPGR